MIQLQELVANKKVAWGLKILILLLIVGLAGFLFWLENRPTPSPPFCDSTYSECFYQDFEPPWLVLICPRDKLVVIKNDAVEKIWPIEQVEEIKHFLNCCINQHECMKLYSCQENFYGIDLKGFLAQQQVNISLFVQLDNILNKYY